MKAGPGFIVYVAKYLQGIATFKRGHIWQVGNGESINIWSDPWIPTSPNRKIISPCRRAAYTKVVELIDPTTGAWDVSLLHDLFGMVDVGRILQIPLNCQGFDDFIAWGLTNHGTLLGQATIVNGGISSDHQLGNSPCQDIF